MEDNLNYVGEIIVNLIAGVIGLFILLVILFWKFVGYMDRTQSSVKEMTEEEITSNKIKQDKEKTNELKYVVQRMFGVEYHSIHEKESQDEIVNQVNLLGHMVAIATTNYFRETRGEEINERYNWHYGNWSDEDVKKYKKRWFEARNLGIGILPELKNRLPHFSHFEPLKSLLANHSDQGKDGDIKL